MPQFDQQTHELVGAQFIFAAHRIDIHTRGQAAIEYNYRRVLFPDQIDRVRRVARGHQ